MNQPESQILHRLLIWLGIYVALAVAVAMYAGKASEAISMLSNLVSGFAGAAFAIMRVQGGGPGGTAA